MPIDGIDPVYDLPAYSPLEQRAATAGAVQGTQQAAVAAAAQHYSAEAVLQKLAATHPGARFSIGSGFDTADTRRLAALGKANIMIDEALLQTMARQPAEAARYESAIARLLGSFDRLFAEAGGRDLELLAWGSTLGPTGLFSTWGVTDPPVDTLPLFELLDQNIMREVFKLEEAELDKLVEDEKEIFEYEQNLEQAEEAFDRLHKVNPHIQSKPAAPGVAQRLKEAYGTGLETDAPARLDEKD